MYVTPYSRSGDDGFAVLEKNNLSTPLIYVRRGALASSPSLIGLSRGTEVTYLIDGFERCTQMCSVPLPLFAILGFSLLSGSFYFLLDRPPKGQPLFFLFFLWRAWSINKIIASQIVNHILQSGFLFVYFIIIIFILKLLCCALSHLCLSFNYFRIWLWRLKVFIAISNTSFTHWKECLHTIMQFQQCLVFPLSH